jgi:hypothetical protein
MREKEEFNAAALRETVKKKEAHFSGSETRHARTFHGKKLQRVHGKQAGSRRSFWRLRVR